MAMAIVMLAVVLAGELYRHLSVKPVALPTLLFELLEVVLLVGCTVTCMLLMLRVRVWEMAAATAAMLAVLLVGELYLGVKPAALPTLLIELLEVTLVVVGSIACALVLRQTASPD
jgi:hypothetical protein